MAGIEFDGIDDLEAALLGMAERGKGAARTAAEKMGEVAQTEVKRQLSLSSHAPGTKTPSNPGDPPSLISGGLHGSVHETQSFGDDTHWEIHQAPTAVQARIQELGGWTGKGHQTYLPPRPYVRPAMDIAHDKIEQAAVDAFRDAIEGEV